jgi:signal transduction histidine kinase
MKMKMSTGSFLTKLHDWIVLLSFFSHATRHQQSKLTRFPLDIVLYDIIDLMEGGCKFLNIEITNCITPLPLILGDYSQLKQIFCIVLINSCDGILSHGTIVIDRYRNENDLILTFTDNGMGIPCGLLAKILQPYFSTKKERADFGPVIIERIFREYGATIDIARAKNICTEISINFLRMRKCMRLRHATSDSDEFCVQNVPR